MHNTRHKPARPPSAARVSAVLALIGAIAIGCAASAVRAEEPDPAAKLHDPSPARAPIMHGVAQNLRLPEMESVAAFVQSQP